MKLVCGYVGLIFLVPFLLLCEQRENQINLPTISPFADIVKHKSNSERSEEYKGVFFSIAPSDHTEGCHHYAGQNISLEVRFSRSAKLAKQVGHLWGKVDAAGNGRIGCIHNNVVWCGLVSRDKMTFSLGGAFVQSLF